MELIPLNCNNCGSNLKVGEDTRFVTCKHCDAQLAVRHEDGAAFTDVIEAAARVEKSAAAIEAHVEKLGAHNEKLFLQGEIERLDREWASREDSFMVRGTEGQKQVPKHTSPAVMGAVALLLLAPAAVPALMGIGSGFSWMMLLGCIAISGVMMLVFANNNRRAARYQQALADHEAERAALVGKLAQRSEPSDDPPPRRKKRQKRLANEDDDG